MTIEERKPRFKIGTTFNMRRGAGRVPNRIDVCTVVEIHITRNSQGELVKIRYVATHPFCGQIVSESDVIETTIARNLIQEG